jgi:hypothetical protein
LLSLLIRNVDLERPQQKRLVPQWGLGLVLSALKLPQFEPATEVDIKFVSYTCCFLLILASGGRRSESHAGSGIGEAKVFSLWYRDVAKRSR